MAMTRKHYQQTADIIKSVSQDYGDGKDVLFPLAMAAMAGRMAVMFELDNPRFDRDKFMEACGVTTK
ncbi:MAG TPA: hypothetical protein VFK47_15555 [Ktedonobacteraceae bacterium]|nr:hypothetical protein [Ktedonobacteraceae bacterium]